ncbi:MAG: hypothetical protein HLX45_10315 [Bacillus sp. (in: Bacteria)]|nr:hypothetical protein [Bacillus sp. (in: firmicutes)]
MNKPIITALATIGIAQFLKMPIRKITGGKCRGERLANRDIEMDRRSS